jgi:osmoprotectant transport system permease protein
VLWLSHAGLVATATLVALVLGVGLAMLVTRPVGAEFRPLVTVLATVGQTMPPVAVLAIAVPILGFGPGPTVIALALYGFLPVLMNGVAGFEGVPPAVLEAADGMGLTGLQRLLRVELPIAAPVILAGIRTSVVINIGTATIGSTVGALTLGTPIIEGLVGEKLPFVIQGAFVVGLFAVLTDLVFEQLDRRLRRHANA